MNFSVQRMHVLLYRAVLLLGIGTAMSLPASAAELPAQNFTRITWLSSCERDESVTFFYLDLLPGGALRYEGVADVKVQGSKEEQLDSRAARQLGAAVRDFLAGKARTSTDGVARTYCVRVQVYKSGAEANSRSELVGAYQSPSVLQKIDELADPKKWACPARLSSTTPGFKSSRYCHEKPAITMTAAGKSACDLTRHVEVYSDGTIYIGTYGPQMRQLLDHSYYSIPAEAVTQLVATINSFEASSAGQVEPAYESKESYYRARPADIQHIETRLTELAGVQWTHLDGAEQCDEATGRPRSQIFLRPDLDRASISKNQ